MKDISLQLEKLPRHIYDILLSTTNADNNGEIADKYGLEISAFVTFISELYINKNVSDLLSLVKSRFALDDSKSLALALDIAGYKLLLADDYFAGLATKFIADNNGNLASYQEIASSLKQKISFEIKKWNEAAKPYVPEPFVPVVDEDDLEITPEAEKNFLLDIFLNRLPEFLFAEEGIVEDINDSLILLLIENPPYLQEFKDALFKSNAKISVKQITIDGRLLEASVSNVIKDFIREQGSNIFGSMELSKYLVSGTNIANFSDSEKNSVRHLLKTYRNLFFFPQSLENVPVENWEIIPLTDNSVVPAPVVSPKEDINLLMQKYRQESLERKALEEEAHKNKF